jgi:signal transduction histidine kinase
MLSAQELLQYITWALFVAVFVVTLVEAIRHPRRSTIDTALLFGVLAAIIAESVVAAITLLPDSELLIDATGSLLMALPYLLLRLVEDFSQVPRWFRHAAEVGLAAAVVSLFAVPTHPLWLNLVLIAYFVVVTALTTVAFTSEAARSGGVTRRRLTAVACGSGFLALDLAVTGFSLAAPGEAGLWTAITATCGLLAGIGFFLGFAPPGALRRAWQAPELRVFLTRAASLPRLPDTQAILRELEHGAAMSLGAAGARIGLWDGEHEVLLYQSGHVPLQVGPESHGCDGVVAFHPEDLLAGQALRSQRALFASDLPRHDELPGRLYRRYGTRNLLAAPITAGEKRIGVLSAHARTTIFAEEDLDLLRLLAGQAAVILESRGLIDDATRVQAREQATRLKDDFLSAAAHDLKSPLTSILGQAQRLQRQAQRGDGQVDPHGLDVIVKQANRLRAAVNELLDATRVEQRALSGVREEGDLVSVLRDVCAGAHRKTHKCRLDAPEPLTGRFDIGRMRQLFENLVENAVKYSPQGGDVAIRAWRENGSATVTVSDSGIGIGFSELPHIFDRFHRGSNVDDRRFPGMGLGLYICRGIVEEHGGRIWAVSEPGQGTTMHVSIPLDGGRSA